MTKKMRSKATLFVSLVLVCAWSLCLCGSAHAIVTFDGATVGNPGNSDDDTGYGGVDYTYRISKHEVTNAEYTEFLNAVAATDTYGLFFPAMASTPGGGITRSGVSGSYTYSVKDPAVGAGPGGSDYTYDNKPVNWVSFFDAMRFVNWLHNGQGNGDTETGVYNISDGVSENRSANAKYWIPSEDEWYKAAYYDPNSGAYYDYPTSTDSVPNNNLPSADTGNSANFYVGGYATGSVFYPMTDVGAYSLSASPYGTFDQGGNVVEWNEAIIDSSLRGLRGGSYISDLPDPGSLQAGSRHTLPPAFDGADVGFRVASVVPEPSTALLGVFVCLGLLTGGRRRN